MEIATAMRESMEAAGLREEHVALLAGVTSDAVRKWLAGKTKPSFPAYHLLRAKLDGFAERMDRAEVA